MLRLTLSRSAVRLSCLDSEVLRGRVARGGGGSYHGSGIGSNVMVYNSVQPCLGGSGHVG